MLNDHGRKVPWTAPRNYSGMRRSTYIEAGSIDSGEYFIKNRRSFNRSLVC